MANSIIGKEYGMPDGVKDHRLKIETLKVSGKLYFTGAIAKNATEQENVLGLMSDKILIKRITIKSNQPLKYRLSLYGSRDFGSSDINLDSKLCSVDANMILYGVSIA